MGKWKKKVFCDNGLCPFQFYDFANNKLHRTSNGTMEERNNNPIVAVEYCGACDYSGHCVALGKMIKKATPNAMIVCNIGRQGSFEVVVNDKLIYSKLQTMALPDFEEVSKVVNNVSQGGEPALIKGQQPVNCVIS